MVIRPFADMPKKQVTDQGGKIINEFKLVKGFTAEFPNDVVRTLESNKVGQRLLDVLGNVG
ncbi:hypothetical protein ANO11243_028740 [Dothideomycetidae sp. 11243]|nr:hypothetical protein ANO11243_028740 [fungal sp. No.11243]